MTERMDVDQFRRQMGTMPAKAQGEPLTTLTITVPLPPRAMHPNARSHWRAKMAPKKLQRETAYLAALNATRHLERQPFWKMAEVQMTWYVARHNDSDNLLGWAKGTIDGIADAGVVDNDRGFVFMPPKQVTGTKENDRRIEIVITERKL